MKNESLLQRIIEGIQDACYIWREEMRQTVRDEGVLIFFIIVPLVYPLLYSWIYNNEVVREVPVVVVDDSHSAMSRRFARQCDASPDVQIKCYASDLDEAQLLVSKQVVKAIYYIPSDFQTRLNRGQQTTVSVYCDMSLMLAYKAAYQTAVLVTQAMNSSIQTQLSGSYTRREEQITAQPLDYADVPIFNPTMGYGNFIIPGVLMLILQQTLVLGIGLSAGTARESNRYQDLVPITKHYHGMFRIVIGKSMCYLMIYAVMAAYLTMVVPRLFGFTSIFQWRDLLGLMVPYLLACVFFGISVSCMVRYRENVMLLVVFVSVPLLFLSGVSWPQSSIPGFWQGISWLFPSTFGVRGFVRMNSMGATLHDVVVEYRALWVQAAVYFFLACAVYRYQIIQSRRHALERLEYLKHRRAARKRKEEGQE
ncbi:MAG: ABC transporter permease [Prevotella sp.]|nr:ABC transporter permease [Prevotella sp.]